MNATHVALLQLAIAGPLGAQQAVPPPPAPSRGWIEPVAEYGKWLSLAGAIALTVLAVQEHSHSDEAWNSLLEICRADNADCALGPTGAYVNPVAEAYYQRSIYYDSRARRRLMFGQIAFAVGAALFIYDLSGGSEGPANIPLDPNRFVLEPGMEGGAKVGWRVAF